MTRQYKKKQYPVLYQYDSPLEEDPYNGAITFLHQRHFAALKREDAIKFDKDGEYVMHKPIAFTPQIAQLLGVTVKRVQALIRAGQLKSIKSGDTYLVKLADYKDFVDNWDRKPGRRKNNG